MKLRIRRTIGAVAFGAWAASVIASIVFQQIGGHAGAAVFWMLESIPCAAVAVWGVE